MFRITPITPNSFAAPAAMPIKPMPKQQATQPTKPTFGLATASFTGQAPAIQPHTPKIDMTKPVGQRLNILA